MACENCGGCKCKIDLTDGALGGRYRIPSKQEGEFKDAVARVHGAVTGSRGWQAAKDNLDELFGQYRED